jgi:hypothetical protein
MEVLRSGHIGAYEAVEWSKAMKPLTTKAFDRMTHQEQSSAEILWGAKAIAVALNTNEDFVREVLAKEDGTPIRKVGGRYCAIEGDLISFIRGVR